MTWIPDDDCMEAMAETLRALGHPLRLRIFACLMAGEASVGELQERLDVAQSLVSQHLRVLRTASVVDRRIDGNRHLYHLKREGLRSLWDCLRRCRGFDVPTEEEER